MGRTVNAAFSFRFRAGPQSLRHAWCQGSSLDGNCSRPLADGDYHHIAATWDGATRRILVDFQVIAEAPAHGYAATKSDNFCIGQTGSNEFFKGDIKRFRIWKVARTAEQMRLN